MNEWKDEKSTERYRHKSFKLWVSSQYPNANSASTVPRSSQTWSVPARSRFRDRLKRIHLIVFCWMAFIKWDFEFSRSFIINIVDLHLVSVWVTYNAVKYLQNLNVELLFENRKYKVFVFNFRNNFFSHFRIHFKFFFFESPWIVVHQDFTIRSLRRKSFSHIFAQFKWFLEFSFQ